MGDDDATVVFGALSVFVTAVILFEYWYVKRKCQDKTIRRADGFFKYVLKGRGRQSWDDIIREITANHAGEIADNGAVDVIAVIMEKYTIHDIEKMNPYAGLYDPMGLPEVNNHHAIEADAAVGIYNNLASQSTDHATDQAKYQALLRVTTEQQQHKKAKKPTYQS